METECAKNFFPFFLNGKASNKNCFNCSKIHIKFTSLTTFRCTAAAAKSLQSCPTLCDPVDGLLPGSPVPGILQARTLQWVAISFSNA